MALVPGAASPTSPNFAFLKQHDPLLVALGAQAERYFSDDPATTLIKVRQFTEVLARCAAARVGIYTSTQESQVDLLHRLRDAGVLTAEVRGIFHELRRVGNAAAHEARGTHGDALAALKLARHLGIWFHKSFGAQKGWNPGPFIPPPDPAEESRAVAVELDRLRRELADAKLSVEAARAAADEEARRRLSVEERAQRDAEERAVWQALAEEAEQKLASTLAATQAQAAAQPPQQLALIAAQALDAGEHLDLDEAETRRLIDGQLQIAGWEADSLNLTWATVRARRRGATSPSPSGRRRTVLPTTCCSPGSTCLPSSRRSASARTWWPRSSRPSATARATRSAATSRCPAGRGPRTAFRSCSRPTGGPTSSSSNRRAASGSSTRGARRTTRARSPSGTRRRASRSYAARTSPWPRRGCARSRRTTSASATTRSTRSAPSRKRSKRGAGRPWSPWRRAPARPGRSSGSSIGSSKRSGSGECCSSSIGMPSATRPSTPSSTIRWRASRPSP